jgi:dipeptide transport system substrate-binding protein
MNRLPAAAISVVAVLLAMPPAPAAAKTLVYCSEGTPDAFNPMLTTAGISFDVLRPIYNRLVEFKTGTTEIGPGLAETWEISEDGTVFTFHLRHDAKWQSNRNFTPTRGVTADDVLFSFERQSMPSNPYYKVSGGTYIYWTAMNMPKLLKSLEKLDDYTVRFTLSQPNAPFLSDLAMDFASIQSKEYADAMLKAGTPEQVDLLPIGTGPFEFVSYTKDATIRYRAFPGYWGPKPKIDTLVFAITTDASVRLAKLRANECQIAAYPNPADLPSIRADKNLQLLSQPGMNVAYLAFNTSKKPLDNTKVRVALSMAIDKKAIIDAVYQGSGQAAKNLIPPTMWGYNDKIEDYKYDPDAAKALLAEAGYPNGFATDLWLPQAQRPYNPDPARIAEMMQADLAKVGVTTKIVSLEVGEFRRRTSVNGEHMMAETGWTGDNGDPDNFLLTLAGCGASKSNVIRWCDREYDDVVTRAAAEIVQSKRAVLYQQAQEIMHREAPFFLIAHSIVYQPLRKEVTGYKMSPFGTHIFDEVDLQ